jgi:hypothetical protein
MPRNPWLINLPCAWPQYVPSPTERTLALVDKDGRLITEHGEIFLPRTWQEQVDCIFQQNLQVFVGGVIAAMQDWLDDMFDDMAVDGRRERGQWSELKWSETRCELSSVRIHKMWPNRNGTLCWQVRNLTVCSCWARGIDENLLPDLRKLFVLLDTGVYATPGSTGQATIKRLWAGERPGTFKTGFERHYRPSLQLIGALQKHAIGSRREAYRPREIFDEAYELDACNGYASQTGELPAGHETYYKCGDSDLWRDPRGDLFTWCGHCWISIYDSGLAPNDVAPFAVRDEYGKLHWPTAPGTYQAWLWSFEAEELRRREAEGEPIRLLGVEEAWAWTDSTKQLAEWQVYMDQKRREAKAESKELSDLVKLCIVAGIGAFGMPYEFLNISAEEREGSIPLDGPDLGNRDLFITREFHDSGTPKHWQSYILAKMNFRIYQELRRCYLADIPVIAVNVDGVICGKRPYWGSDPEIVKIGEFKIKKMGTWISCPGPGMVLDPDNQRIQVPGMSLPEKRRAMGLWRIGEKETPRRGERPRQAQSQRVSWGNAAHANADRLRRYILKEEIPA